MIRLAEFILQRLSWVIWQAQNKHKCPKMWKKKAEETVSEWCDVKKTQPVIHSFEDGSGHEPRNVGSP